MLDSAANSVGNKDIISDHLAFSLYDLQILAIFLSVENTTFWILLVLFGGSDVLSVGFS